TASIQVASTSISRAAWARRAAGTPFARSGCSGGGTESPDGRTMEGGSGLRLAGAHRQLEQEQEGGGQRHQARPRGDRQGVRWEMPGERREEDRSQRGDAECAGELLDGLE